MSVDLAGETIGSYQIIRQIGLGGMGQVYLAEHRHLKRKAAVKVLSRELVDRPDLLERFFLEARATSLIQHPGIVQIFDCEVDATGRPYIVMEYLDGDTLSAALLRRAPLPPRAVARIARGIAEALAAAHDKGIIHRDLKPDNIFVQPDPPDSVKLVDFGIAKLAGDFHAGQMHKTHAGALMGTPLYMSPEQCRDSGKIDASADLYSLGCVMYEMISGHPPFQYGGLAELVVAHMTEQPSDLRAAHPSVPLALTDLTAALLRKLPAERPASAREVADRLATFAAEMTTVPEAELRGRAAPAFSEDRVGGGVGGGASQSRSVAPSVAPSVATTFGVAASELIDAGSTVVPGAVARKGLLVGVVVAVLCVGAAAMIWKFREEPKPAERVASGASLPGVGGAMAAGASARHEVPAPSVRPSPEAEAPEAAPRAVATATATATATEPGGKKRSGKGRPPTEVAAGASAAPPEALAGAGVAAAAGPGTGAGEGEAVRAGAGAAAGDERVASGLWDGHWTDPGKRQEGSLRLQIGDDGAVTGWMQNKVANQTFRLAGRIGPRGTMDLTCQCPAAQNFRIRGTARAGGPDEFKVRMSLSTGAGVFGESVAVMKRTGAPAPAPKAASPDKWPQILPGTWYQPHPTPTLYRFRADGTGARTTYPSGVQTAGQAFPFNWLVQGTSLVLRFPSGWADVVTLSAYSSARNTLDRSSSRGWGNGPWFGCASGRMPPEVKRQACP